MTGGTGEFRMPSLGADMDSATVVKWLVAPGATVRRGDLVAEVETDKGVFDVDVREGGVVAELLVAAGTKVAVGTPILRLAAEGAAVVPSAAPAPIAATEALPAVPAEPAPQSTVAAVDALPPTPPEAPSPPEVDARARPLEARPGVRASPVARRMADAHGLTLAAIHGTGPHGVVTMADVERALDARGATSAMAPPAPAVAAPVAGALATSVPSGTSPAMAVIRQTIAAAVARSKREIPHYYLVHDVDLRATMAWLAQANAQRSIARRLLPAALLVKALARALEGYPDFNGFFVDGHYEPAAAIHVGIVTALRGGGLLAPAIHEANTLSVDALNAALLDVVRRARGGGIRASELTDATISVTSLGDRGVRSVTGVIYPPQVAIVGFGTIAERPWADQGMLDVRPAVTVTLAADHRVSDGHRGGLLLAAIGDLLQHPEAL
jgi:pyruvate dehydrogenase E2 component (dihydrolipoamide acetyltransferase)